MTDTLERVARAIFEAGGYPVDAVKFENHKLRNDFMQCARAAVEALREPDSQMKQAGERAIIRGGMPDFPGDRHSTTHYAAVSKAEAGQIWQAMIDAILKD